ncbi:MAG: hypothetical protein D6706_21200 [Chloroflexi bacterium]|nr:MAG: hypothetical protein D6706_21200 [Chloroflexota bacterium]
MAYKKYENCQHCGTNSHYAKGLCHACYGYKSRTGRDRPSYLFRPQAECVNCGQGKVKNKKRGLCARCYAYWARHKKMRPPDAEPLTKKLPEILSLLQDNPPARVAEILGVDMSHLTHTVKRLTNKTPRQIYLESQV